MSDRSFLAYRVMRHFLVKFLDFDDILIKPQQRFTHWARTLSQNFIQEISKQKIKKKDGIVWYDVSHIERLSG